MRKLDTIRKGIFIPVIISFQLITHAQSSMTFTQAMDNLLGPLDKNRITTGILYERVKPFANLDFFNVPSADPYIADYSYYCQAYFELYNAAYNKSGWTNPNSVRAYLEGEILKKRFNIGILDYQFNTIDSNAIYNGGLTFSNGQFHDVPGRDPYWTKKIQAAAILADEVPQGLISIIYNPNLFKTNQSIAISSIQLNFGASGVYTLSPSTPVVQVNFTGSGVKSFIVTVYYTNGTSFSNTSEVQVGGSVQPYSRVAGVQAELPDNTFWITSKYPYQGTGESQPYYAKAKVSIWWKRNAQNQPVPGIRKPVIVIDGFDPKGDRPDTSIYKLFQYYNQNNNQENFADELRVFGKDFDIIVVDMPGYTKNFPATGTLNDPTNSLAYPKPLFDNSLPDDPDGMVFGGGDFQQRNAYVLEYLIDYCNQQMQINGSNEKLVIVGPSMGGQISRYALRDMEIRGQNHNCRLWVSFDSNNEGSYAPVGVQYSLNQLAADDEEATYFKGVYIDCPEAKQSLLHHYLSNSETVMGVPGFFDQYYGEVNAPSFGFPQASGLRKIVMISGSDLGVPQTFGTACQLATKLEARYRPRRLLAILFYSPLAAITSPILTHKTYLAPASGQCNIYKVSSDLGPDDTKKIYAPSWSNTSLDMVQGGFFPAFRVYKEAIDGKRPKKWFKNPYKLFVDDYIGNQVQQLTYSTLAIGLGSMPDPTRKWDANFRLDKFNQPVDVTCPETKESPFDMYWGPDVNTRHDSLLLGHVIRLRREIIDNLPWQKTQIQRQGTIQASKNYLCNGESATFSMIQPLSGLTYNWSSANPYLQITSGQGTSSVTIQNNGSSSGYYVVNCQASSPCYLVNANYTIHVGYYGSNDYPITGPSQSYCGSSMYFSAPELPGATSYDWFWPSNWYYMNGQGTRFLTMQTPYSPGTYLSGVVGVRVSNVCGLGGSPAIKYVQITCGGWRIRAFPNPTRDNIVISTTQDQKQAIADNNLIKIYQVKIIDQLGNVKKQYSYPGGITNISISALNLAAGVYIIQAYNGETWETTKFVKQ